MKNRIISLVIALTLIAGMIPAVVASAEEATTPEIISQNIEYNGYFGLMYAVDAATVKGGKVTVAVYDAEMNKVGSYTKDKTEDITTAEGKTVTVYAITTAPVAAKDMADVYYAKATDGEGNESELKRYSVGEYLYERLYANGVINAEAGTKEYNKKVFYENVLAMGASAQTVLVNDKKAEGEAKEALVTDYKYVSVTGGKLADGYTAGIFEKGTSVTLTHTATAPEGKRLVSWKSASQSFNKGATITLDNHLVLTPTYEDTILTFETTSMSNLPASLTLELSDTGSATFTKQHGQQCLYVVTKVGKADTIKFGLTDDSEENYNTTVFETDFQLSHGGGSSTYNQNISLCDASGNVAYSFTLRHGNNIQMNDGTGSKDIASHGTWVKFRLEYTYINETSIVVKAYVNNSLVYESTKMAGSVAIKDVCFYKHTSDTGVHSKIFYDNVSFKQIKK